MISDSDQSALSAARRRRFIIGWIVFWSALGAAAIVLHSAVRRSPSDAPPSANRWREILANVRDGDPHPLRDPERYVWDEACLLRPRADVHINLRIGRIGGGPEVPYAVRHVQWGVVRPEPLPEPITAPTILLVGDSHAYGFCDVHDNGATLLEKSLRNNGFPSAVVVNGSCPYYGLYQVAQRMRSLARRVAPRVCVAVVFAGNDFVELEDPGRPHLDDDLNEMPINPDAPAETTSARRAVFNRCRPRAYNELFWQGMNQAIYLHERPKRYPVVMAKAVRCLEIMQATAAAHGATLIVVILPAYDDFVDFALPFTEDPTMRATLAEQANRRLRQDLANAATGLGIEVIDALPIFQACELPDLYAGDFHIWKNAHRLIAEALAKTLLGGESLGPP